MVGRGELRKWSSRWLAETKGRDANATLQQHETLSGLRPGAEGRVSRITTQSIPSGTTDGYSTHTPRRPACLSLAQRPEGGSLGKWMAYCDDGEGRQACLQKIRDIEETGPCAWSRIESQAKRKQRPKLPKLRILLACLAGIKQRPKATAQRTSRRARWPRPTPPSALGTVAVRGRGRRRTARDAAAATGRPPRQAARDGPPAAAATRAAARPADGRPRPWRGGPSSCSRCPPSSS